MDEERIERFQRDVVTGSLALYDSVDVSFLYKISAAATDPTGDYLVGFRAAKAAVKGCSHTRMFSSAPHQ